MKDAIRIRQICYCRVRDLFRRSNVGAIVCSATQLRETAQNDALSLRPMYQQSIKNYAHTQV